MTELLDWKVKCGDCEKKVKIRRELVAVHIEYKVGGDDIVADFVCPKCGTKQKIMLVET